MGALLFVLALTWYLTAERNIRAEISRFQTASLAVEAARTSSFDANLHPRGVIRFDDLAAYVAAFRHNDGAMAASIGRLSGGDFMGFWTGARRQALVAELNGGLKREKERVDISAQALRAERSRQSLVAGVNDDAHSRRSHAINALTPATDEDGYSLELVSLTEGMAALNRTKRKIEQARGGMSKSGAEAIRRGLCAGMIEDLEADRLVIEDGAMRARDARKLLRDYKSALRATLSATNGVVVVLDRIARDVQPDLKTVFDGSGSIREFIHTITRPIPGLFDDAGKPVTLLSSAAGADRRVVTAGDLLQFGCVAIEVAHREVDVIVLKITPLSSATAAFVASNRRDDMLRLIDAAPSAAAYFEQHAALFDPALEKLDSVRPYVELMDLAAMNSRSAGVRFVFHGLADGARKLIDSAAAPLEQGKTFIGAAGASLRSLEGQEQAYRTAIEKLRSDNPSERPVRAASALRQGRPSSFIISSEKRWRSAMRSLMTESLRA